MGWIFTRNTCLYYRDSDYYAVEVASGTWFGSLIWPGAVGLVFGGPVDLAAWVAVGGIMAYEFEKYV
jgi:hypothetical protein